MAPPRAAEPRRIGIVLFDGVEELDAVGPWEVFAAWTTSCPGDGYEVLALSPDGGPVTGAKGLVLGAAEALERAPALEVIVHPGGKGPRPLVRDGAHLDWVRARAASARLSVSVCTGALVYAAAGMLAGRPATTHWSAFEELLAIDPSIDARRGERFVDDGTVLTSAGVSAGIDLALHVVDRLAGRERARAVRHQIEYDPAPPV
jgi:transcriptional regulator GlxA family with amidase domain